MHDRIPADIPVFLRPFNVSYPDDVSVDFKTIVLKTLDLHHSLNPLVEGTSRAPSCTEISGVNHSKLFRPDKEQNTMMEWVRGDKTDGIAIYGEKYGFGTYPVNDRRFLTTLQRNRSLGNVQHLTSTILDDSNNHRETRDSRMAVYPPDGTFRSEPLPPILREPNSSIDTEIRTPDGKLKGTITSEVDEEANTIDTLVKDAAGKELRRLSSTYERNLFSPDLLCTKLK